MTEFLDNEIEQLTQWTEVVPTEWTVTEGVWTHMDQSDRRGEVGRRLSRSTRLPSSGDLVAEGNRPLTDGLIADDDEMDAVVLHPDEDRFLLTAAARSARRPFR